MENNILLLEPGYFKVVFGPSNCFNSQGYGLRTVRTERKCVISCRGKRAIGTRNLAIAATPGAEDQ